MLRRSLRQLGWLVARDVNRTVGGGLASMELLRRTFTTAGWLDATGHGLLVAASRVTPGTNLLAYCVGLGWRVERWPGALVALVMASLPASLLVWGLAATLVHLDRYPLVRGLQAVGILVATVLVFLTAWHLVRPYLGHGSRMRSAVVAAVTTGLMLGGVTPVRVLLAAAAVGFCLRTELPSNDSPPKTVIP